MSGFAVKMITGDDQGTPSRAPSELLAQEPSTADKAASARQRRRSGRRRKALFGRSAAPTRSKRLETS